MKSTRPGRNVPGRTAFVCCLGCSLSPCSRVQVSRPITVACCLSHSWLSVTICSPGLDGSDVIAICSHFLVSFQVLILVVGGVLGDTLFIAVIFEVQASWDATDIGPAYGPYPWEHGVETCPVHHAISVLEWCLAGYKILGYRNTIVTLTWRHSVHGSLECLPSRYAEAARSRISDPLSFRREQSHKIATRLLRV
jgi:hypothetical protein